MVIKKGQEPRISITEQKPFLYIYSSSLILMFLYAAFVTYDLSLVEALMCSLVVLVISLAVVVSEISDIYNTPSNKRSFIETPTKQSLLDSIKPENQLERVVCYNPVLQVVVEPLSIRNIFHAITNLFLLAFLAVLLASIIMYVGTGPHETSLLAYSLYQTGFILFIAVTSYIALNALNYIRVLRHEEGEFESRLIQTSYTQITTSREIQSLNVRLGNKSKDEDNILGQLNDKCHEAARELNDLVVAGYIDSELISKEKAFIEYSINEFIPTCIKEIKDFFEKQDDQKIAKKVFNETGRVELEKAIYPMLDKVEKIIEAIKQIEKDFERRNIESLKSQVANKDWAGLNKPNAALEYVSPYFQEYHLLEFPSLESKVVANNIVKKTLPKLVELENTAKDGEDLNAIREQIESTKQFVKSIAVGTDESKQRRQRIQKQLESSLLHLESESTNNPVQNLARANQRYLETLDKTLPAE